MQLRRLIPTVLAGAAVLAVAVPLGAATAQTSSGPNRAAEPSAKPDRKRPAFRKYVACRQVAEARPSRRCRVGADKGAFFRSNVGTVRYSVCVRFPTRRVLCAKRQRAKQGELYLNEITSSTAGRHLVTWWVKGKKVGAFRFRLVR